MGDKEDKRTAFQIAHMVKTKYCEFCPASEGCELSFYKDDVQCWHRFHEWYRSVDNDNALMYGISFFAWHAALCVLLA